MSEMTCRTARGGGRLRRRPLWITAAAATAVLVPSAALAGGGPTPMAAEPVTITFMGPSVSGLGAVFDAYEEQNPNVTIEALEIPFDDYFSVVEQRIGSGSGEIDVFEVDPPKIREWVGRDYLYDLTDDLGEEASEQLRAAAYEGTLYQDRMWSMPIWDSTQILFYNRGFLGEAGIEAPSPDPEQRWTWDQLVDAAAASQEAGATWGFAFEQAERYYQLQVLPESLGGGPGVTGDDLLTVDLTNDGWTEAVTWYAGLHADGIAPPNGEFVELTSLFTAGDLAFYVTGPWNLPAIVEAEADGLEWGFAPHPYFAGGEPVTPSESWHWGVNPNSENIEVALDLLAFGGSTEGNLAAAAVNPLPPTNVEATDTKLAELAALSPSTEGIDELVVYELNNTVVRRPRSLGYTPLEEFTHQMWGSVRRGADPEQALADTQSQLEATFERIDPDNP